MDYQSNSDKNKESKIVVEKKIEKVVTGEVVQKPKSIGRKFKTIFFGGDIKLAAKYVTGDVLLPALRNLIVDATSRGIERFVYGESTYRRRPTEYRPRVQYSNPINPTHRTLTAPAGRPNLPDQVHPYRREKQEVNDIVLSSRQDAEVVVERMIDIIEKYDVASLADLYDLLGLPTSHVDNKWGWTYLNNVEVRQVQEGYLIELPTIEAI